MNGWKKIPIGDVVESPKTWNPSRSTSDEVFNYIDLSAVDQDLKLIVGAREVSCKEAPSRARQLVAKGDIIVSTVRPNLNGVAQVPEYLDGATASTGFCILRPCYSLLDGHFLFHWVKSPVFIADMINKATGASYPAVSDRIILESILPLPSLEEQKIIADILDRAEALRAKRRDTLAQLDELTKSIFIDMFGDVVKNEKSWSTEQMGNIMQIRRGGSPRPIEKYLGGEINWIKIGDGTKDSDIYIESCSDKIIPEGLKKTVFLRAGSLIFANCGVSLGFARILKVDGCIHDGWLSLEEIPEDKLDKLFLLKALNSITEHFRRIAPSGTQPNLNTGLMKNFRIILPPLSLQKEFSHRIAALEKLKTTHKNSLAELDELFASLQYRAFRGELGMIPKTNEQSFEGVKI